MIARGGCTRVLQSAAAARWCLSTVLVLCADAYSAAPTEEKLAFEKPLGDGLTVVAVFRQEEGKPLSPQEIRLADEVKKQTGLERARAWAGRREVLCFRLIGKGTAQPGKDLLTIMTKLLDDTPLPVGGKFGDEALFPDDTRVYDIVKPDTKILILLYDNQRISLQCATLDSSLEVIGQWHAIELFGRGWPRWPDGFLPIARAQIIPVNDGAYVFFASKSGKCMLWEVKGRDAKMVWNSDERKKQDGTR